MINNKHFLTTRVSKYCGYVEAQLFFGFAQNWKVSMCTLKIPLNITCCVCMFNNFFAFLCVCVFCTFSGTKLLFLKFRSCLKNYTLKELALLVLLFNREGWWLEGVETQSKNANNQSRSLKIAKT